MPPKRAQGKKGARTASPTPPKASVAPSAGEVLQPRTFAGMEQLQLGPATRSQTKKGTRTASPAPPKARLAQVADENQQPLNSIAVELGQVATTIKASVGKPAQPSIEAAPVQPNMEEISTEAPAPATRLSLWCRISTVWMGRRARIAAAASLVMLAALVALVCFPDARSKAADAVAVVLGKASHETDFARSKVADAVSALTDKVAPVAGAARTKAAGAVAVLLSKASYVTDFAHSKMADAVSALTDNVPHNAIEGMLCKVAVIAGVFMWVLAATLTHLLTAGEGFASTLTNVAAMDVQISFTVGNAAIVVFCAFAGCALVACRTSKAKSV